MTKQISYGFNDTPISGVSTLKFERGLLNYKADFRTKSNTPGEVIITNITSPVDRPENIRYARSEVKNVYANTDIDPSVYAPSTKGVSIVAQVTETLSVTDSADSEYRVDLPVSAHIVLKTPASEHVDAAVLETVIGRLLSSLFETGKEDTTRLEALLRGSLLPTDI